MNMAPANRIIRKPELLAQLGVTHTTVWRWEKAGKFPKRLRLGKNACGWLKSEVEAWIQAKADAR